MDVVRRVTERVGRALAAIPPAPGGVVVAVSGGPDSVALLRVLADLDARRGSRLPPGVRVVAHFNHGLRGAASDGDEAFVRELAARLPPAGTARWQVRCARADVAAAARAAGANLEATARHLRYRWLAELAEEVGAGRVATGHQADDQAETVLHRLFRGTGLRGLRGIAAARPLTERVGLVRPLLGVTRAQVLAYLGKLGQPYRHDASNDDRRRTRNRIRRQLLPHLSRRYNPAIGAVLARLAEQAAAAYATQEALAADLLARAERPRAGPVLVFDREALNRSPPHLLAEAMRLAWVREGWPLDAMSRDRWRRLIDVAAGRAAAVDLPGRVRARRRGGVLQIERA